MTKRRIFLPMFLLASMFLLAGTATAQVSGPCKATIAGVDANSASTPQTAVQVEKDDSIAVGATGPSKFTSHKVMLEFAGIRWTVDEETDDDKAWSSTVNVATYAKYGVGLYKVIGESTGNVCSGAAYVNVKGSPLTTAAGAAGAAATVIGGGLAAASAVRAARRPGKKIADDFQSQQLGSPVQEPNSELPSVKAGIDYYLPGREPGFDSPEAAYSAGCFGMLPMALFHTMAFMVSGAGAPGAPGVPAAAAKSKVGFKLLISVSGVIGAFFAGVGTLVLAQQFGVVYPTRTVTIIWLVAAIVIEILLTSLAQRSGVKKVMRMLRAAAVGQPSAQPEDQV